MRVYWETSNSIQAPIYIHSILLYPYYIHSTYEITSLIHISEYKIFIISDLLFQRSTYSLLARRRCVGKRAVHALGMAKPSIIMNIIALMKLIYTQKHAYMARVRCNPAHILTPFAYHYRWSVRHRVWRNMERLHTNSRW